MTHDDPSATAAPPEREEPAGDAADADSRLDDETLTRALGAVAEQIGEIRGQLDRLLHIQLDRAKLALRAGMLRMVVSTLLGAAGVTGAVVGVAYLVSGAAGAFSELFDGRAWAGELAAGALSLLAIVAAIGFEVGRRRKRELKRMMRKYEPREEGR